MTKTVTQAPAQISRGFQAPSTSEREWGDDWTVSDTETAGKILDYLGFGQDASKEPGADRRRDHISKMIRERIDASSAPADHMAGAELLATVKEFARWHHLNELTIFNGGTPSDSEIDLECTAWNTIQRALAATEV